MNKQFLGFDTDKAWDYENAFYLTCASSRLSKAIVHWELYKLIKDVPGDIVECGTFKGVSFLRFLTYREMLESQFSRRAISFDAFADFPRTNREQDDDFINRFEAESGVGISIDELKEVITYKGFSNYELVEGNIFQTLKPYTIKHPALKIALLHLDVDVYDATLHCLDILYERVVRGGIIIFDDYAAVEGANKAVDEFLDKRQIAIPVRKFGYYSRPSYIVKE